MSKDMKLRIQELERRRALLCEECNEIEQEVRMMEDEIEEIDNEISELEKSLKDQND